MYHERIPDHTATTLECKSQVSKPPLAGPRGSGKVARSERGP